MMKVLITGAGGPAAISVWKSLHQNTEIVMADMDPMAAGLYLVGPNNRAIVPAGADSAFCSELLRVCIQHKVDVCISTVDAELAPIARRRDEFQRAGVGVPIAAADTLALCRSKSELITAVAALGVPVPRSARWSAGSRWDTFPAFAKPDAGSGSRGLHDISSVEDLESIPRDGSYVVQEYLPHEEYSVDTFAVPTEKGVRAVAAVVRERMKTDSGIAVTARTVINLTLQKLAIQVVEGLNIPYVANVQFKKDSLGGFKFLEVNPRFPGTLPLTTIAGIDMPKLLIGLLSGDAPPKTLLPYEEKMIVRYMVEHVVDANEFNRLAGRSK